MSDTLITVIAIALAAVLMFVFPLMTMSVVAVSTANWETSSVLSDIVINGKTNINTIW